MAERPSDRPHTPPRPDPTRDIRLPPLPDRPAPAVPPEWSSYVPPAAPAPAAAALSEPAVGATVVPPHQVDEPTDRLASADDHPLRQPTRTYEPPPSVQLLKVSVTPTRRRTTKVLWTLVLLTLAVIIACGVYLLVFVNNR
jgi:hypothetical protein